MTQGGKHQAGVMIKTECFFAINPKLEEFNALGSPRDDAPMTEMSKENYVH